MVTAYISVTDFGAKGDGSTDDQAALQAAFNYAKINGVGVYLPPGIYNHSNVLKADGITVFGAGESSVLKATNPELGSLFLTGTNPAVYNLKVDGSGTTRGVVNETNGITIDHATGFTVENVHVVNAMGVGIMNWGGSNGTISHNYIEHSFADSIHNTLGAHDVVIEYNKTFNSGDDGIAVVSYSDGPGSLVYNITIQNNTILDNLWGRGLTVVGGENVKILNNHVEGMADRAGLYIAAEGEYNTLGVKNVVASGNTFIASGGIETGHGAITLYNSQGGSVTVTNVVIENNDVLSPRSDGVLVVGDGVIQATITNTKVYASSDHHVLTSKDAAADIAQTGNVLLGTSSYPGDQAPAGGGVSTTLLLPVPIQYGGVEVMVSSPSTDSTTVADTTPVSDPVQAVETPTTSPAVQPDADTTTSTGKLTLHVSGDQWRGNPKLLITADGKQLGTYEVTASHKAGLWQDIVIDNVGSPQEIDVSFINDAYGHSASKDRNAYIGWIDLDGTKILGTSGTGAGTPDPKTSGSLALYSNGQVAFHPVSAAATTTTATTPAATSADTSADLASGTLVLHVSGDQWKGDPLLTVRVDGKVIGTYDITASHGAGETQDILIGGVGNAKGVELSFNNDAYGGSASTDRNVYVHSIELNGQQVLATSAASNTSKGTPQTGGTVAMESNGTLTFDTSSLAKIDYAKTLIGTEHSETLTAGTGLTITGGGGKDVFVFNGIDATGNDITDFQVSGTEHSTLDFRPLIKALHYTGTDPIADHFLSFTKVDGGTAVTIDRDGNGPAQAVTLALLEHVDPSTITAQDFLWH